jgi:hypothetical protein
MDFVRETRCARIRIAVWYALTLTAVLFISVVMLLHQVLAAHESSAVLRVTTVFGVVAGTRY